VTAKAKARVFRWVRRSVQAFFLLAFLALVLVNVTENTAAFNPWLQVFFLLDPLILAATALATYAVPLLLLWGLVTIGLTLVLGRAFCGWICPLGTVHAACSAARPANHGTLAKTEQWSEWNRLKYYLLAALLVMALLGLPWIGVLDPFSLLYRTAATALVPAAQYAVEDGSTAVFQSDPRIGSFQVTTLTEPPYRFLRDHVFIAPRQAYDGATLILVVFLLIVGLNLFRKRFWCRYLCPLGALLGLAATRPMLRLVNDPALCNECGLCRVDCQGAAVPDKPGEWRPAECMVCMNCAAKCNKNAISFALEAPWRKPRGQGLDLSKRALLASGAAGVGALLALRLTPQAQARVYNPDLVRPPGAREERAFLKRCVQCGLCMRVCPTSGLQPTLLEAGFEGLWTPRLVARVGYCEFECNACGHVCPTHAIEPLAIADKQKVKLGLATFDTSRCLPYAYQRDCIVCEEHCPVHNKAIHFIETDIRLGDGGTRRLKLPYVDPDRCIGCGICENKCVFRDQPAIRVTSANESRHPKNQPILPGLDAPAAYPYPGASDNGSESATDPYGF
jgi:MauM/NapG family ferredoxin protein